MQHLVGDVRSSGKALVPSAGLLLSEHKRDRRVDTRLKDNLPGYPAPTTSIGQETASCPVPVQIGYRSFDRQWIIPDKRLINQPNPRLWAVRSEKQVYLTAISRSSPTSGPGLTCTALVPDLDHYHGRGGRAFPLWLDADTTISNVRPPVLDVLAERLGSRPSGDDVLAYLAAVCAHPGYTATFAADLANPGVRVPLTTDPALFAEAVELGRRVVWLHCYGQRFADPTAGRPRRAPRMDKPVAPQVLAEHPIPSDATGMPDILRHDAETGHLLVGTGAISPVSPAMWAYEISGVRVLTKWFSYRRRSRERPTMGRRVSKLLDLQPPGWLPEYTSELIDLLNVLGLLVGLEPRQAALLDHIVAGPLLAVTDIAPGTTTNPGRRRVSDDHTVPMFDIADPQ